MLSATPYNPATDDLWLYRQEVSTYGSSTQTLTRPYAWNPNSRLYGYRNSLQALRASNRTLGTYVLIPFGGLGNPAYQYFAAITPDTPANKACYYNSWPPTWIKASDQHLYICRHCFDVSSSSQRNPSSSFVNYYGDSNHVLIGYRWIKSDNTIISKNPSDFTEPYVLDGDVSAGTPVSTADVACIDLKNSLDVPAINFVNAQTITQGTRGFVIDCNGKIMDFTFITAFVRDTDGVQANANYLFPMVGSPNSGQAFVFMFMETEGNRNIWLHDSGDLWFVEISPPSSLLAGDGVLGMIPGHVVTLANHYNTEVLGSEIAENVFSSPNVIDGRYMGIICPSNLSVEYQNWAYYWASRGAPYTFLDAPRANQALSSESVEQQILNIVQQLTENQ